MFRNDLKYDSKFNIYTYRNFYNGGGVAMGDVNNDGLVDLYFSANQSPNKLYLNKGNFVFEDVTERAGVAGTRAWSTGVSMADVNGDGWLDIYVCNSGNVNGDDKENELFINNGDLTFTERGEEYGVADKGYTTHAVFFDYDKDGDLDLYVLNNSYQAIGSFNLQKNERNKRDSLGGHKLLRNDHGHFVDVSEKAGIYGSVIAFGLGVTVGDINKDGWLDIYVCNSGSVDGDDKENELFINNGNLTFSEKSKEYNLTNGGYSTHAAFFDQLFVDRTHWAEFRTASFGLRHWSAGSPRPQAESGSQSLRTGRSPPVALHLASRRRSYLQLRAGERLPEVDLHHPDLVRSQTH